jgi:hypothetical protein
MSNLFTKIYMLHYITNLYLQLVLEMMSIHFSALIDTFHHVPRNFSADYDSCPKVNLFHGIF